MLLALSEALFEWACYFWFTVLVTILVLVMTRGWYWLAILHIAIIYHLNIFVFKDIFVCSFYLRLLLTIYCLIHINIFPLLSALDFIFIPTDIAFDGIINRSLLLMMWFLNFIARVNTESLHFLHWISSTDWCLRIICNWLNCFWNNILLLIRIILLGVVYRMLLLIEIICCWNLFSKNIFLLSFAILCSHCW